MAHEKNLMDAVTDESLGEMFSEGVDRDVVMELVEASKNWKPSSDVDSVPTKEYPSLHPSSEELLSFLHAEFGHTSFRPGQEEAIASTLAGKRSLIILPTGTGKSLCYQFPSAFFRKTQNITALTIVVSPLIALMADQLHQLPKACRGAALHSNLSPTQASLVYAAVAAGAIDVLFLAPERLLMYSLKDAIKSVFLIAVDEAHCLSEWSHSFRPAYLAIPKVIDEELRPKSLLALTATATIQTVESLSSVLSIDTLIRADGIGGEPDAVSADKDPSDLLTAGPSTVQRDNLELFAQRTPDPAGELLNFLCQKEMTGLGPIIVYVQYKFQTDQISQVIRERGLGSAEGYHGGLSAVERREIHRKFMHNELRFVVATIAFGMGIDKRNVRAVIHLTLPKSIENYVQETGRCCRDGLPGFCRCYFKAEDYARIRNRSVVDGIRRDAAAKVVDVLLGTDTTVEGSGICQDAGLVFVPEKIDNVVTKQHMSLLLSLIEGERLAVVHHGFPRVLKLRFFRNSIAEIAAIDPFVDWLFNSPYKPKAGQTTASETGGVVTVDLLSAMAKVPTLTPPQFMHQLAVAARAQGFAIAKAEWGHFVLPSPALAEVQSTVIDKCFNIALTSHSLELNRLDASFALMSRIAVESLDDPKVGHKLIQHYFQVEARLQNGEDLVPSVLEGAREGLKAAVLREINNIRGTAPTQ